MTKMRYFKTNFQKSLSVGNSARLTSDFVDLKLGDVPKSGFSNGLWKNRT